MLKIRLSRIGKKKKPIYRLIISEQARDTYGKALEILGTYDPFTKELISQNDRIEHWLSNGAQMSPTVNNLLIEKKIIKGEKVKASINRKKEEEKTDAAPKPAEAGGAEEPKTEKTEEKTAE